VRFSSYNILSNKLPGNGYVLLNGLTGAMELIDDGFYNYIQNNTGIINDTDLPKDIIEEYIDRGFITNETEEEEKEYTKALIKKLRTFYENYNLVIVPNLNCNYRCIYCFERDSEYFKNKNDYLMTKEVVDGVFNFIEKNNISKRITLFGGEPLNKNNIEIIDYIINEKNKEQKHSFSAVTNGHDLGHFLPYLGKNKIEHLQITVDGPKRIHDKRRISLANDSSFDNIFSNISRVIKIPDVEIGIRINVDMRNLPFLEELMQYLKDNQLLGLNQVHIYTSKVTGIDTSIADELEMDLALDELHRKFPYFSASPEEDKIKNSFEHSLLTGSPLKRADSYCGGTGKMLVFTPDKSVYSCWEYVGKNENVIGKFDLNGEVDWNKEEQDFLDKKCIENNQTCIKCPYVLFCLGGCFKQALMAGLDYEPRQCKIYKTKFKGIMEQTVEHWIDNNLNNI